MNREQNKKLGWVGLTLLTWLILYLLWHVLTKVLMSQKLLDCVEFEFLVCFGKIKTFEVVSVPECKLVLFRNTHISLPFELFE